MRWRSISVKIILSTLVTILVVGIFSYSFLYKAMVNDVLKRADEAELLSMERAQYQLNLGLDRFYSLGIAIANKYEVARGLLNISTDTLRAKKELLKAQILLTDYYNSSVISDYVDKIMVFNASSVSIQATTKQLSYFTDAEKVQQLEIFGRLQESGEQYIIGISPSILPNQKRPCIAMVGIVEHYGVPSGKSRESTQGWIYMELNLDYLDSTLLPFTKSGMFVSQGESASLLLSSRSILPSQLIEQLPEKLQNGETVTYGKHTYHTYAMPLNHAGLMLYACSDITLIISDQSQILVTVGVVSLTSVIAVILLAVLLSIFILRPLDRLTRRIKKISENDFSYDPEIEKGGDEIADVGKMLNIMSLAVRNLLDETKAMYEQRKNSEIALLQSQVNPHFLYNTLDSIHWMAVIQNNPGIAKTSRSLSNLLRNLAKGVGDKITLEEEISLLQNYVDTQSVRFMEMFELVNNIPKELYGYKIIKLTLQPLVENAIFHGLEPSEKFGTITLSAYEEDEFLIIKVHDNGVGMDEYELEELGKKATNPHPSGMSGIGVANVNSRLKLVYGEECGLTYTSEKLKYTCVTARIIRED